MKSRSKNNSQEIEKKGKDNDCYGNNRTHNKNSKLLHNGNSEKPAQQFSLKALKF
jgi:hypothetical protein